MSGVAIKINGIDFAHQSIRKTQEAARKRAPALVGQLVVNGIKASMVREEDPETGLPWPALQSRKGKALRDTGRLMRSIHYEAAGGRVTVGTNVIYAATHQYGDPNRVPAKAPFLVFKVFGVIVRAKRVHIPQRRFLPESDVGLNRIAGGNIRAAIERILRVGWGGA